MGRKIRQGALALVLAALCWGANSARGQYYESYPNPAMGAKGYLTPPLTGAEDDSSVVPVGPVGDTGGLVPSGTAPGYTSPTFPLTVVPAVNQVNYPGQPIVPGHYPGMPATMSYPQGLVRTSYPPASYQPAPMGNGPPITETPPEPRLVPSPGLVTNPGKEGETIVVPSQPGPGPCPRELAPTSLPPYTIAPPDILFLDAIRMVPKPPYRIEPLEVLLIHVSDTLPNQPIMGQYVVSPEGFINLGYNYGSVRVGGLTLEQAQTAIRTSLTQVLRNPQVTVALAQFRGLQQIRGQHLIRPDGTISLGTYGSVYVAGLTLGQAKCVIEKYLSQYLLDPQIAVDVLAYNSKVYYVIFDGGGFGQQVFRLPVTGNETVLDALGMVQGLAPVSSKKRIWLARPSPANLGCNQILPVDWNAITMAGSTATNYQVFPGDRIYVSANRLIAFDNYLSMVLMPIERVLGATLLATYTGLLIKAFRTGSSGIIGFR